MSMQPDRRTFLQAAALTSAGYFAASGLQAAETKSPMQKIQLAAVGCGGKGASDIKNASKFGKFVALCDVDQQQLKGSARRYKTEALFSDFREMFDKMGDKIDAVTVSTPDHAHAVIIAKALRMKKHVYGQKPLTRTIYEAHTIQKLAAEAGTSTQMGNQWTAYSPMRKMAYQIRAGMLGNVKEVHVWTNRPVWPQGERRPMMKAIPAHLDWDSWLASSPYRAYGDGYHPFKWRGWWDFGTGALGDMACHTCNLPFMALNMRDPVSVEATTAPHDGDSYPAWSRIKFEFPAREGREAFTLHWYDGSQLPDKKIFAGVTLKVRKKPAPYVSGTMIIGDKAKLYAAGDYAEEGNQLIGDSTAPEVEYPKSPGHVKEWFMGMEDASYKPMSNFVTYGGPLTETILLGNLAVWSPGKVEWDAKNITPTNRPELARIVNPGLRAGYEL